MPQYDDDDAASRLSVVGLSLACIFTLTAIILVGLELGDLAGKS